MNYIRSLGGSAHYAGNTVNEIPVRYTHPENGHSIVVNDLVGHSKTMFIDDPNINLMMPIQSIEEAVLLKFGYNLPFRLQTNSL